MTFSQKDDLEPALHLAESSANAALSGRSKLQNENRKADGSLVTDVDVAIERQIVDLLRRRRSTDAVLGEEFGLTGSSERLWLIDPIDGTEHYVGGRPDWGTNIALQVGGEIVLGVVTRPDAGGIWYASRGRGAFRRSRGTVKAAPLQVSGGDVGLASRIAIWEKAGGPLSQALSSRYTVVESDLNAILDVAEGSLDGVIDVHGKPWDHAPYAVLVEEAGGRFSDRRGKRSIENGLVCYSTNGIHASIVEAIGNLGETSDA